MSKKSKNLVKLATELTKYYTKKALGDDALTILVQGASDIIGDDVTEKIESFLDQGDKAERVLDAFTFADNCFVKNIGDDLLKQMVISKPLAGIEHLEQIAQHIPTNLDDRGLLESIRNRFELDWPGQLTDERLDQAAIVYRDCLDKALLIKLNQIHPTLFRKIDRIEKDTQKLLRGQDANFQHLSHQLAKQTDYLLNFAGLTSQILVQGIQYPQPDIVPLQPEIYLEREEIIINLQKLLVDVTWLSLVDGPGKGKTQLAITLLRFKSDQLFKWISLRNKESIAPQHFREQLVLWLCHLTGDKSIWFSYISGIINFPEVVNSISLQIKSGCILVIDDLPDPVSFEDFYFEILFVSRVLAFKGVKIVTTGQRSLPPIVEANFPVYKQGCPFFDTEEILILLKKSNVPKEIQSEKIAVWINATTRGHPSLVVATIHWIKKQGEEISLETYDGLIEGKPMEDTLEYHRRVLVNTLDISSRELIYLLSLIGEKFNRDLAIEIAQINPLIENPSEVFDSLKGLWIDKSEENYYELSPLLSKSGQANLPFETQQKVHLYCAEQYLRRDIVDISKAHIVLMHLWQAQDYQMYAHILILLLLATKTKAQAEFIDWANYLFIDVDWPDEINLGLRIMIRAAQVRNLAIAEKDYVKAFDDMEILISLVEKDEFAPAILFAYVHVGILCEPLPVEITIPKAFMVIQLINSMPILDQEFSSDLVEHLPNAIWSQGMHVKSKGQITMFIDHFSNLMEESLALMSEATFATEVSTHLIDQSWFSEASKPTDEQNWEEVISFLDGIFENPLISRGDFFRVAFARAKSVIYAEYLNQLDEALLVLDEFEDLEDPDADFIVNYTKGCLTADAGRNKDAERYLSYAKDLAGSGFAFYRLDCIKRLAIIKSSLKKYEAAKALCIEAIHRFAKSEVKEIFALHRYEMFGELAFIHWSNGDVKKACGAMFGFVMALVEIDNYIENNKYKEAFNKAGHGLGWFVSVVNSGKPPSMTLDGEEYAHLYAGIFGIPREQLGNHIPPFGFSKALMLNQLARFAQGAGLLRMSWKLYHLSLEQYQLEKKSEDLHLVTLFPELANLEMIFGSPQKSLEHAINAVKFMAFGKANINNLEKDPKANITVESVGAKIADDDLKTAERHLLYIVFAPLVAKIVGQNYSESEISDELEKWETAILELQRELFYKEEWIKAIRYVDDLYHYWKNGAEVEEGFQVFDDSSVFELFRYLVRSVRSETKIKDAFRYQVTVSISLPQYDRFSKYLVYDIGKFIHKFWLNFAYSRRFAVRNPQLFLEKLLSIKPTLGGVTISHVLIEASHALGIDLPSDVRNKIKQLRAISEISLGVDENSE